MEIISVIEQAEVIKAILQHDGLWEAQKRLPQKTKSPPFAEAYVNPLPATINEQRSANNYADPDYAFEAFL